MTATRTIAEIVARDLCIGCGLCEAVTRGRVRMVITSAGSLRPSPADGFTPTEEATLVSACPGAVAEARVEDGFDSDPVWGAYRYMARAWAGHRDVRHEAATGGVLTALGMHALRTGRVNFVLARRRRSGAAHAQPLGHLGEPRVGPGQHHVALRADRAAGGPVRRAGPGPALRHHRQAL